MTLKILPGLQVTLAFTHGHPRITIFFSLKLSNHVYASMIGLINRLEYHYTVRPRCTLGIHSRLYAAAPRPLFASKTRGLPPRD
jgi:hypothetical protein